MLVKEKFNRLFRIRGKDKLQSFEEEDTSPKIKKKWRILKNKHDQNYSQWDLMENMAEDPVTDEEELHCKTEIIASQLAVPLKEKDCAWNEKENLVEVQLHDEVAIKKRKSFLKRSGSLLRRSLRRAKKSHVDQTEQNKDFDDPLHHEDLTDIVHQINETLVAVATFGESSTSTRPTESVSTNRQNQNGLTVANSSTSNENSNLMIVEVQLHNRVLDDAEPNMKTGKFALRKGLQRQASKLISRFQSTTKSFRLKSAGSVDSLPNHTFPRRKRAISFSGTSNLVIAPKEGAIVPANAGGFKRKLSFKKAKKAVKKGVSSFGKNMAHASAVMPVAFEGPPASYYPYYETGYQSELGQCNYRTQSYLPQKWDDEQNLQYTRRPASFYYQHGYCYN